MWYGDRLRREQCKVVSAEMRSESVTNWRIQCIERDGTVLYTGTNYKETSTPLQCYFRLTRTERNYNYITQYPITEQGRSQQNQTPYGNQAKMPRTDISFQTSDNVTLRGWFFDPTTPSTTPLPCLVMSHGFTALKEMDLDTFASHFVSSLLISCLVYDNRGFGASDNHPSSPRQEIIPFFAV